MKFKGIMHVHSQYSDGEASLPEIKEQAKRLGMSFVFLADHVSLIRDEAERKAFNEECRQLSDGNFLFVPGFEVKTSEGFHTLAYNTTDLTEEDVHWEQVVSFYEKKKGVFLALAHASQFSEKPPEEFLKRLDGIEVWNAKYDSKAAPNLKVMKWAKDSGLIPLAGSDAHSSYVLGKLWVEVEADKLEPGEIINALRRGDFRASNGGLTVDFEKNYNTRLILFLLVNAFYRPIRKTAIFLINKGFKPPKMLKKIFHRIY